METATVAWGMGRGGRTGHSIGGEYALKVNFFDLAIV